MNRRTRRLVDALNKWFDSLVMAGYICFMLWDYNQSFRRFIHRCLDSIKAKPKTVIRGRLRQELEELLSNT